MSASADFLKACCTHRLVADLREVVRAPLPDVVALPESEDLRVWHGNVRSSEGCLGGAPIHFMLVFPDIYPQSAPEVRLFQAIPHPNVRPASSVAVHGQTLPRQARWRLAMWDCMPDTNTWSSAYTVSSILLELQAFLLREDMADFERDEAASVAAITREALHFSCPHCAHSPKATYPAFLTEAELATCGAAARLAKKLVTKPHIPRRSAQVMQQLHEHQQGRTATAAPPAADAAKPVAAAPAASAAAVVVPVAAKPADAWCVVSHKHAKAAVAAALAGLPAVKVGKGCKPASAASVASSSTSSKASSTSYAAYKPQQAAAAGSSTSVKSGTNTFSVLMLKSVVKKVEAGAASAAKGQPSSPATAPTSSAAGTATSGMKQQQQQQQQLGQVAMSKAAKKNLARKLKRQQQQQQQQQEEAAEEDEVSSTAPSTPSLAGAPAADGTSGTSNSVAAAPLHASTPPTTPPTASSSTDNAHSSSPASATSSDTADDSSWATIPTKQPASNQHADGEGSSGVAAGGVQSLRQQLAALQEAPHQELIQQVLAEWHQEVEAYQQQQQSGTHRAVTVAALAAVADDQQAGVLVGLQQPMGLFSRLAREDLLAVMALLQPQEVARLAVTCQGLRAAAQDGALWQALLRAHYPGHQLAASRMSDWQTAYKLEASCVLDDLRCFYTRVGFEADVLCLPLNFTINPRTQAVDYIEAYPECIALSAFTGGVDRTSNQEPIKAVLPLYITAEHFTRAQPHYARVLCVLAPERVGRGGTAPPPATWLEVLPKILNTCVVLLCDHGTAASHKALVVYAAVHRLLLAMCEAHNLWPTVRHKLDSFLASPSQRSKEACPNLGLLLPLLSLSRTHSWPQLGVPLLEESLARSVMWMCKANPKLEARFCAPRANPEEVDAELLSSFETARVSTRLMMFHLAFLHLVGAPGGCRLETVMDGADALYGHPGSALAARFLRAIRNIMQVESWGAYFSTLGMPMSDAAVTAALKAAWVRSCKRGYTYKGMDYGKIQSSGVSKILLKGQSYTAPPNMKQIELRDVWKWKPTSGVRYLDASILLYHSNGVTRQLIEAIDYSHTASEHTSARGAVQHSGDVLQDTTGTHTVQVNLKQLGPQVNELYVVVSAWSSATLSDIVQPFVQVCDPGTGMVLCEYHLEDQPAHVRRASKSVIMARIYRTVGGVFAASSGSGAGSSSTGSGVESWKVQALGVVGQGCAGRYGPIQQAIAAGKW